MKRVIFMMFIAIIAYGQVASTGHTVMDSKTGLEWQDDQEPFVMNWQEAINYCEVLELSGYSDWRVPNINELKTLVDTNKREISIINGFEKIGLDDSSEYWSSTSHTDSTSNAWIVYFYGGGTGSIDKGWGSYVRCVRDGQ